MEYMEYQKKYKGWTITRGASYAECCPLLLLGLKIIHKASEKI